MMRMKFLKLVALQLTNSNDIPFQLNTTDPLIIAYDLTYYSLFDICHLRIPYFTSKHIYVDKKSR